MRHLGRKKESGDCSHPHGNCPCAMFLNSENGSDDGCGCGLHLLTPFLRSRNNGAGFMPSRHGNQWLSAFNVGMQSEIISAFRLLLLDAQWPLLGRVVISAGISISAGGALPPGERPSRLKQGERGPQFHGVDLTEHRDRIRRVEILELADAFEITRAEQRVTQIGAHLPERADRIEARRLAAPQSGELGEMNHIQCERLAPAHTAQGLPNRRRPPDRCHSPRRDCRRQPLRPSRETDRQKAAPKPSECVTNKSSYVIDDASGPVAARRPTPKIPPQ